MIGALRRAAIAAAIALATMSILMVATTLPYGTTPLALLLKYWFIYLPALALTAMIVFAAAVNNWLAGGDPQKEI